MIISKHAEKIMVKVHNQFFIKTLRKLEIKIS